MKTAAHALLVAAAIRKHEFRDAQAGETVDQYLAALIDHVETRDFAEAHELRLGKPQAEWTPEEGHAFRERLMAKPFTSDEFRGDHPRAFLVATNADRYPPTDAEVRRQAREGVASLMRMRREQPTKSLAIFASVLLLDGTLHTASVGRGDRIALIKALAREMPVYGFYLVGDMFLHGMNTETGQTTKTDAIVGQVGTRTMRLLLTQRYRIIDGFGVSADDLEELDVRAENVDAQDPYAEIFVSVPRQTGAPS